jgi:hypothetical protein
VALGKAIACGTDGDGADFGGIGVAMASSSVTVTDLNPFFINWSKVAGIASIVGG